MSNLPVAVLISGGGPTLRNLIVQRDAGLLPVDFRLVISGRASAMGLNYAHQAQIDTEVIVRKQAASPQEHSDSVFAACRQRSIELVVMGGYLDHLLIPEDFSNRVVNIHPSLIPAFCGRGFYGLRVHQAVLDYGAKLSGCTVHFVDNEFDHGPIIAQRACAVMNDDTAETLQARVFELECELYPETIAAIARGQVHASGRQVQVRG
ncbi:MAG: phosphoribosylglycinamide formyltransferase [Pirellulaceae bacterium]|nr:phosphoribosylglycinamide formyltransferase [Pirellulaceae bacterium]